MIRAIRVATGAAVSKKSSAPSAAWHEVFLLEPLYSGAMGDTMIVEKRGGHGFEKQAIDSHIG